MSSLWTNGGRTESFPCAWLFLSCPELKTNPTPKWRASAWHILLTPQRHRVSVTEVANCTQASANDLQPFGSSHLPGRAGSGRQWEDWLGGRPALDIIFIVILRQGTGAFLGACCGDLRAQVLCLVPPPTLTLWLCSGVLGVSSGLCPYQGNYVANGSSVPVS